MGYRDNMRNLSDYWPPELNDKECDEFRTEGSQAHNQYLNVAATTGTLGLLFFLTIILYFLSLNVSWFRKEHSLNSLICLTLQVYFLLSCMTEITFEFSKIRYLILGVWAVVINNNLSHNTSKDADLSNQNRLYL
jgi:O-antigen ligase